MRIILLIIALLVCGIDSFCQKNNKSPNFISYQLILKMDSLIHSKIPQLKLPLSYKNKSLPAIVDNSEHIYFRPLFEQVQNECGQASGVGMNFTYEIDFLRNLPANIEENQYPTHYTWNFENGGNGWSGVNYFHSFEILKMNGIPNVSDYGGMSAGGPERWLSGYQEYFNGMHNRINQYYAIKVGTPGGLLTLKHWLNDHLNSSEFGGVASIYSDSGWNNKLLPEGTPEGGKHVVVTWGPIVGHALTICGYNDSIRYDYNGDGIYTNNIDINEDDEIDMKDWEVGGLKYANNYWQGNSFADSGFCYVMYKTLADEFGEGGLWNNEVHVVKPKEEYTPLLTVRTIIKHNSRDKVKILVGISNDTSDVQPIHVLDFPIFDFQGGNQYMQGGDSIEENKTIEFGLDISPLLNEIDNGQLAKVFLQLLEYDPANVGTGEIIHFSVIDYSNGTNEIYCNNSNVQIVENGTTTLSVVHLFNFYDINIESEELPVATLYEPYEVQLSASGGNDPYSWIKILNYAESNFNDDFVEFDSELLVPNDPQDGFIKKQLEFNFPIYGKEYNEVFISTDGFIFFDKNLYPWPYLHDEMLYLKNLKLIAPFLCEENEITVNSDNGIWYSGDENSASFRWKASFTNLSSEDYKINVAVCLYNSGEIELMYGENTIPENQNWIAGLSNGDSFNYQISSVSNQQNPQENHIVKFSPSPFVNEIEITDDGILQGIPENIYEPGEISVRVCDNNNISTIKTFNFNTDGLLMEYTIEAEGNDVIEASESVKISFTILNNNIVDLNDASFKLSSSDPYISIVDSIELIGLIAPGETIVLTDVFEFNVAVNIPNNHPIQLIASMNASEGVWERSFTSLGYSAVVTVDDHYIADGGNCSLTSNETANLILELKNNGMAKAKDIEVEIETNNPYIAVNSNYSNLDILPADSIWLVSLNISVSEFVPFEYLADINYYISIGNGIPLSGTISVKINHNVEDFESNGTELFPWIHTSLYAWDIDSETTLGGSYSLRSANIGNNQSSSIFIVFEVLEDGEICFFNKVSCEDSPLIDSDYLKFEINGIEVGRWDGQIDWSHECFDVEEGINMFKWTYKKNQAENSYSDCVWIDNIIFPSIGDTISLDIERISYNEKESFVVYPNPFDNLANINITVIESGNFNLDVYNINGIIVKTILTEKYLVQGQYLYTWDGQNNEGVIMADGLYYCVLRTSKLILTSRLIMLR